MGSVVVPGLRKGDENPRGKSFGDGLRTPVNTLSRPSRREAVWLHNGLLFVCVIDNQLNQRDFCFRLSLLNVCVGGGISYRRRCSVESPSRGKPKKPSLKES